MRVRVALEVGEGQVGRHEALEGHRDVAPHRGSACSFTVRPAVVCGQYTRAAPSCRPLVSMAFSTSAVTSINATLSLVSSESEIT